jgi:hypothetical protein
MSMMSRWPVLVSLPVGAGELDAGGQLTEAAVERLFAEARDAYFAECTTLDAAAVEVLAAIVTLGAAPVGAGGVTVSACVVEVFPDSFTMSARVRPVDSGDGDGFGVAATAWCSLSPGGEVTEAMRDEFIAHAHAATHFH